MKKILNSCLDVLSKIIGVVCLTVVNVATGTISTFGPYEPEMPIFLKSIDNEERE
jgi:hypothetical protein